MPNKKITALGIFIAVLLALGGCTKNKTSSSNEKTLKIGFVLATMNEERYNKDRDYFLNFAKSKNAHVEFTSADNKVSVQTSKVETLLAKGIDALVIQPVNGEAAASIVRLAKRDQVPVVAYDRLIKNADIDAYVTQDSVRVGVLQAEAAVKATGGKGNYILLMGEAGHSVAEAITSGYTQVLKNYPQVNVIVKQYHPGWSSALALSTVENALTRYKNKVDAIIANNDGMAMGAIRALEEQKLVGKVFVAGADADVSAVKNVVQGKQSVTILKGIRPLAEQAARVAIDLAQGKKVASSETVFNGKKEVLVFNTPVFMVNKDNVETQIIDYGFHSKEAIYGKLSR